MNTRQDLRRDPRKTLFDVLDDHRVGMLGVVGSDQHMQPMTHHCEQKEASLWFIGSKHTDLVRTVGVGARAHYCLMVPDRDFYTCLSGSLQQSEDSEKLDQLWSPVAAAWFDEGRSDHDISLLRFLPQEAAIWSSTESGLYFGLEIVRSNVQTEHKPDVMDHIVIRFDGDS